MQCMYAFNKATRVLGMIKRTVRCKDTRVMMSLYKTLLRPHVEYCVSVWRRNRQDLIGVFKICNGLSRIELSELFTLDDNMKGTRGHS